MPEPLVQCEDFSGFQDALKAMRRTDDIIVNTINSAVPTDSFHKDEAAACKNLHEQLSAENDKRENLIKSCIAVTTDNVKRLREQREKAAEDLALSKQLRAEQTKLRMLKVELTVEDLLKQRTSKVFNERCRKFYKPL